VVAVKPFQLILQPKSGSGPIVKQWGINLIEQSFLLDTHINAQLVKPVDISWPIYQIALSEHMTRYYTQNKRNGFVFQDEPDSGLTLMAANRR
jgi:hypothetical protein